MLLEGFQVEGIVRAAQDNGSKRSLDVLFACPFEQTQQVVASIVLRRIDLDADDFPALVALDECAAVLGVKVVGIQQAGINAAVIGVADSRTFVAVGKVLERSVNKHLLAIHRLGKAVACLVHNGQGKCAGS